MIYLRRSSKRNNLDSQTLSIDIETKETKLEKQETTQYLEE